MNFNLIRYSYKLSTGAQNYLLGYFHSKKIKNYKFYSLHLWNCKCIYNICRICHIGLNRQFAHEWWQMRSLMVNIYRTMKHLRMWCKYSRIAEFDGRKIRIWLEKIQLINKFFQFSIRYEASSDLCLEERCFCTYISPNRIWNLVQGSWNTANYD